MILLIMGGVQCTAHDLELGNDTKSAVKTLRCCPGFPKLLVYGRPGDSSFSRLASLAFNLATTCFSAS